MKQDGNKNLKFNNLGDACFFGPLTGKLLVLDASQGREGDVVVGSPRCANDQSHRVWRSRGRCWATITGEVLVGSTVAAAAAIRVNSAVVGWARAREMALLIAYEARGKWKCVFPGQRTMA